MFTKNVDLMLLYDVTIYFSIAIMSFIFSFGLTCTNGRTGTSLFLTYTGMDPLAIRKLLCVFANAF